MDLKGTDISFIVPDLLLDKVYDTANGEKGLFGDPIEIYRGSAPDDLLGGGFHKDSLTLYPVNLSMLESAKELPNHGDGIFYMSLFKQEYNNPAHNNYEVDFIDCTARHGFAEQSHLPSGGGFFTNLDYKFHKYEDIKMVIDGKEINLDKTDNGFRQINIEALGIKWDFLPKEIDEFVKDLGPVSEMGSFHYKLDNIVNEWKQEVLKPVQVEYFKSVEKRDDKYKEKFEQALKNDIQAKLYLTEIKYEYGRLDDLKQAGSISEEEYIKKTVPIKEECVKIRGFLMESNFALIYGKDTVNTNEMCRDVMYSKNTYGKMLDDTVKYINYHLAEQRPDLDKLISAQKEFLELKSIDGKLNISDYASSNIDKIDVKHFNSLYEKRDVPLARYDSDDKKLTQELHCGSDDNIYNYFGYDVTGNFNETENFSGDEILEIGCIGNKDEDYPYRNAGFQMLAPQIHKELYGWQTTTNIIAFSSIDALGTVYSLVDGMYEKYSLTTDKSKEDFVHLYNRGPIPYESEIRVTKSMTRIERALELRIQNLELDKKENLKIDNLEKTDLSKGIEYENSPNVTLEKEVKENLLDLENGKSSSLNNTIKKDEVDIMDGIKTTLKEDILACIAEYSYNNITSAEEINYIVSNKYSHENSGDKLSQAEYAEKLKEVLQEKGDLISKDVPEKFTSLVLNVVDNLVSKEDSLEKQKSAASGIISVVCEKVENYLVEDIQKDVTTFLTDREDSKVADAAVDNEISKDVDKVDNDKDFFDLADDKSGLVSLDDKNKDNDVKVDKDKNVESKAEKSNNIVEYIDKSGNVIKTEKLSYEQKREIKLEVLREKISEVTGIDKRDDVLKFYGNVYSFDTTFKILFSEGNERDSFLDGYKKDGVNGDIREATNLFINSYKEFITSDGLSAKTKLSIAKAFSGLVANDKAKYKLTPSEFSAAIEKINLSIEKELTIDNNVDQVLNDENIKDINSSPLDYSPKDQEFLDSDKFNIKDFINENNVFDSEKYKLYVKDRMETVKVDHVRSGKNSSFAGYKELGLVLSAYKINKLIDKGDIQGEKVSIASVVPAYKAKNHSVCLLDVVPSFRGFLNTSIVETLITVGVTKVYEQFKSIDWQADNEYKKDKDTYKDVDKGRDSVSSNPFENMSGIISSDEFNQNIDDNKEPLDNDNVDPGEFLFIDEDDEDSFDNDESTVSLDKDSESVPETESDVLEGNSVKNEDLVDDDDEISSDDNLTDNEKALDEESLLDTDDFSYDEDLVDNSDFVDDEEFIEIDKSLDNEGLVEPQEEDKEVLEQIPDNKVEEKDTETIDKISENVDIVENSQVDENQDEDSQENKDTTPFEVDEKDGDEKLSKEIDPTGVELDIEEDNLTNEDEVTEKDKDVGDLGIDKNNTEKKEESYDVGVLDTDHEVEIPKEDKESVQDSVDNTDLDDKSRVDDKASQVEDSQEKVTNNDNDNETKEDKIKDDEMVLSQDEHDTKYDAISIALNDYMEEKIFIEVSDIEYVANYELSDSEFSMDRSEFLDIFKEVLTNNADNFSEQDFDRFENALSYYIEETVDSDSKVEKIFEVSAIIAEVCDGIKSDDVFDTLIHSDNLYEYISDEEFESAFVDEYESAINSVISDLSPMEVLELGVNAIMDMACDFMDNLVDIFSEQFEFNNIVSGFIEDYVSNTLEQLYPETVDNSIDYLEMVNDQVENKNQFESNGYEFEG